MQLKFLRCSDVEERTGYSRSTIYNRIAEGLLPEPVKIGIRASAWPDFEINAINAALVAGKSDEEIRALVARLVAARKTMA
ncbi:transcriptional regulator, AlpA family [Nitrosomonas marina]|uniref:Transcriptional regulator, AlpA family n=1 Tax=Nitrosomonas marina TaxID=917 RepID=A0A1I0GG03_9PROT|nr:AlpA family phage regulatory protein [Nitrosomonas marina]SET70045.1 transcriptional regulator, AlpA family [Nitrosomonas marina]